MKYALQINGKNIEIFEGTKLEVSHKLEIRLQKEFNDFAKNVWANLKLHSLGEGILEEDRVQSVELPEIELIRLSN